MKPTNAVASRALLPCLEYGTRRFPESPFERTRCAGDASRARGQRGRVDLG